MKSSDDAMTFLVKQTFDSHTSNKTDPDDVTVGVIQVMKWSTPLYYPVYPHTTAVQDFTTSFFPNFQTAVELPWTSYSYPTNQT